jgi:hypothetical protein
MTFVDDGSGVLALGRTSTRRASVTDGPLLRGDAHRRPRLLDRLELDAGLAVQAFAALSIPIRAAW